MTVPLENPYEPPNAVPLENPEKPPGVDPPRKRRSRPLSCLIAFGTFAATLVASAIAFFLVCSYNMGPRSFMGNEREAIVAAVLVWLVGGCVMFLLFRKRK